MHTSKVMQYTFLNASLYHFKISSYALNGLHQSLPKHSYPSITLYVCGMGEVDDLMHYILTRPLFLDPRNKFIINTSSLQEGVLDLEKVIFKILLFLIELLCLH